MKIAKMNSKNWLTAIGLVIVLLGGTLPARADTVQKIAGDAPGNKVQLEAALGSGVLLAGRTERAYLKVGLTGFKLIEDRVRPEVNLAIVLDRSGSMQGDKIRKAKEAALMAIDRLSPEDIVSVIAYNHNVEVLVPATKVRDRREIERRIMSLGASGNTALFAGVAKGAYEVRKFLSPSRVNRVLLVSDGLANEGPSTPGELGDLGHSLLKGGISVTTIGLGAGYNEDLMFELARRSDGNHAFAEGAADLARIFSHELGDVLSVVAREVNVRIKCSSGIRPIRVLGRTADISGNTVIARLNQLYAEQEKYLLVEVEIPASPRGSIRKVASVDVTYLNAVSQSRDLLSGDISVKFSDSMADVTASRNEAVLVSTVDLVAAEQNRQAVILRDQGKAEEAKDLLMGNAVMLEKAAKEYKSPKLKRRARANRGDADNLAPAKWNEQRKKMRDEQFEAEMQQAW